MVLWIFHKLIKLFTRLNIKCIHFNPRRLCTALRKKKTVGGGSFKKPTSFQIPFIHHSFAKKKKLLRIN